MQTVDSEVRSIPTPASGSGDWRLEIPEPRRRRIRVWLAAGALLTVLILIIGGITRLTRSGLSIVEWSPIMGVFPPSNEAEWVEAFRRYQQFPEYQKLRQGMSLPEFKFIYFWEYTHRLAARLVGVVFLIPFLVFWARGYFNPPLLRRVLLLFGLGALQGFMGWYMVKSGLAEDPAVSHYRLAAHLGVALSIFSLCYWLIRDLRTGPAGSRPPAQRSPEAGWVYPLGILLGLQILWGAFVAGLDAGLSFNTFPLMGGELVPPGGWTLTPVLRNLLENPPMVQWVHRVLGTTLLLAAVLAATRLQRTRGDGAGRRLSALFAIGVAAQYGLGVLTLLNFVPVPLGVAHQLTAVLLLGVWLSWLHRVRNTPPLSS